MRRVVYADSFVADADGIAVYLEKKFGTRRADIFVSELGRFCELVAYTPGLGKMKHGYATQLYGAVFDLNWIFFQYDEVEVRFIHIVDGRRDKSRVRF